MPRYNPYGNRFQQPEQYDTGEVPYISYQDPDAEKIIAQGMQNMQQRYDLTQSAMGKYMEENAKGDFSDKDYVPVMSNLNSRLEKIRQNVKDKYQGDYGAAANEVIQELGKARNIFFQAEAEKKKEDKYGPLLDKMKAESKLVWEPGKSDPRLRSAFDENGKYTPRDYSGFREKNDYDKWINENVVTRINNTITDNVGEAIKNAETGKDAFITMQKVKGLAKEDFLRNPGKYINDDDVDLFLQNNPTYAMEFSGNKQAAKEFLINSAADKVFKQVDVQPIANPHWKDKSLVDPNQPTPPKLTRLYSTSTIGEKLDLSDVPLADPTFKGQVKRDFIRSMFVNNNNNLDTDKFTNTLKSFTTGPNKTSVLSNYIQKDQFGEIDFETTLNNIEQVANKKLSIGKAGYGSVSSNDSEAAAQSAARDFLKDMNEKVDKKVKDKFGDYGVDVMGFDLTDKGSAETYSQMNDYMSQVSPDVFNFETGKFADKKTSKLSNDKEFIKTRGDGKFKIQGVIKSPDGGVKYIAEDGSGEPQVVSSNSDVVNRNLLRMFGSPDLIANYEYRDFKLTPSGNIIFYKPEGVKEEKKLKLKGGYKVEKESTGKYKLIDSNNNIYKENGQPRLFDKWEIIHNVGVEE